MPVLHIKNQIHDCPIKTTMNLNASNTIVASDVRETHGIFAYVRESLFRRSEACITAVLMNFTQIVH